MLAALLILALDVTVTLTPEPIAVQEAVYGRLKGVGTWSARICPLDPQTVTVSGIRVYAAAARAGLRPIGRSRVLILLERARYERPGSRIARAVEWGVIGATAFGAGQQIPIRAIQVLALSIPIAKRAADVARERVPVVDLGELLDGDLELAAGACAERVLFSGLVRGAATVDIKVPAWPKAFVSSITSIPERGL